MFSPYGYMDSYPHTLPHHRDHVPYPCHRYPSWEAVYPQTRGDAPRPHPSFGPWPINGSVVYPSPTECNSCCSHSYPPGFYSFRPPYPHISPPPQVYYHGSYPPYCDSYPSSVIPPPHYSADQNSYDYNNAKAHCCGCPNHTCSKGDNKSVKIEEQHSGKDQDNESSSLIRLPNYPYPVVWFPPSYSKNKETNKSSASSPAQWNGWIPMDDDSPNSVKPNRNGKNSLPTDARRNQFPWPIIWMPGDHKLEDAVKDLKEINSNPKVDEKLPSKLKIIPLKLLEDENRSEKPGDADDKHKTLGYPEAVATEKESRTKTIPVKHLEEENENRLNSDEKHKDKEKENSLCIPEKKVENGAKKSSNGKQLSQAKTSKLPPVCLRVDPLPRKKTTNGTSRSPSPPSLKDKQAYKDKPKGEQPIISERKEEMHKKEIQVVDANDKLPNEAEKSKKKIQDTMTTSLNEGTAKVVDNQQPKKEAELDSMKVKKGGMLETINDIDKEDEKRPIDKAFHELDEGKRHMDNTGNMTSEQQKKRRNLSQSDAATSIQAAYRGFEVRRWQPLQKLWKIHQICEKAKVVKKQIQEFAASSKEQESKQKAVISETIMNQNRRLDTIQGLHQSVRDVRKSVARELISLQEKLDALGSPAIAEHEIIKVEHCPTGMGSDREAISAADSVEANHSSEITLSDGKDEAPVEQPGNVETVESPDSAAGLDNFKLFKMGSTPEEHEEIASVEEQLSSALGEAVESNLMEEEVIKPLTSISQEVSGTPSTCKDEVTKLESEKHLEGRGIDASLEQVRNELCNHVAGNDAKDNVEVEDSSMPLLEGEVAEVAAEESNPELLRFVEPTPGVVERVCDVKANIFPGDKVDTMIEELQVPALQNNDLVKKTAADTDAVHIVREVPCSEQAIDGTLEDVGSTVTGLPVPTSNEGHSSGGALETGQEDGVDMMQVLDAMNTKNGECHSSDKAFEANFDKVDGAALEKGKVGLVSTEDMENTIGHLSVPTNDKGYLLDEESEPCKEDGKNPMVMPDAVNINKDECGTMNETLEANVNKNDGAAAEEGKDGLVFIDDMFSGQQEGFAHAKDTIELSGPVPGINLSKEEKKLVEENEKLREMLERLLEAGKEQLGVIADLNGRVKDLERKLSPKKRCKVKSFKPKRTYPPSVAS